jgi:hypothetical protein
VTQQTRIESAALLDGRRRDRRALIEELTAAGAVWSRNERDCCCPWHRDGNPSAGVFEVDGIWKFKCFVCGERPMDVFDVEAKRKGKRVEEVVRDFLIDAKLRRFSQNLQPKTSHHAGSSDARARAVMTPTSTTTTTPAATPPAVDKRAEKTHFATIAKLEQAACWRSDQPSLTCEARHEYVNPDTGQAELIVFRLLDETGAKEFRQGSPHAGGFVLAQPPGPLPLYNRTRLRSAEFVVVVEGEKCVHALTPILDTRPGWAATTSPGGADNADKADWTWLGGKSAVYLWPDADDAGVRYMQDVADRLAALSDPPKLFWVNWDTLNLPPAGDVADWIAAKQTAGIIEAARLADALDVEVFRPAQPLRPSAPLLAYYRAAADGRIATVPWPWRGLTAATQALQPGHLTILCGEPGSGKSFFLVQALDWWLEQGIPAACLMLELSEVFHGRRLHASLTGESGLLRPDWIREHAGRVEALYAEHADRIDRFWGALETVPRGTKVTAKLILDWLERRCRDGARVVICDPFTAVADDTPWTTDVDFLLAAQKLAETYAASIVLTVHPDRGGKRMARSEGLRRFVDGVIWLHERSGKVKVQTSAGQAVLEFNRQIKVTKARLASGAGMILLYQFQSLRFTELGVSVAAAEDEDDDSTSF